MKGVNPASYLGIAMLMGDTLNCLISFVFFSYFFYGRKVRLLGSSSFVQWICWGFNQSPLCLGVGLKSFSVGLCREIVNLERLMKHVQPFEL